MSGHRPGATERVWDPLQRVLHWALVAAVAAGWVTAEWLQTQHEAAGYAALAIVVARVGWGVAGTPRARFARFVRGPAATLRYAAQLARGAAPRHLGHNPLGAWMVIVLLGCVLALAATGWLYGSTERFGGAVWLDELHQALAWALLVLAALHVAGVALTGWRHGENLVRAMVTGRKRARAAGDRD